LVFEALKRWRQKKTRIVITHDLSHIKLKDFVYVLKDGTGRSLNRGFGTIWRLNRNTAMKGRRPSSVQVLPSPTTPGVTLPLSAHTVASRQFSLQFTPTSPTFSNWSASRTTLGLGKERDEEEDAFEKAVEMSGSRAGGSREKRVRKRWDDAKISPLATVKVDSKNKVPSPEHEEHDDQFHTPAFWEIICEIFPTIPYKPLLFLGLFTCIASGQ
jgi:ATP-binding cassette subfamily B (MDR/TAP) protein 1